MFSWHANFVYVRNKNVNFRKGERRNLGDILNVISYHVYIFDFKSLMTGTLSRFLENVLQHDLSTEKIVSSCKRRPY